MKDMDYRIEDIDNEPRIEVQGQRWDYVKVIYEDGSIERKYYHVDCDSLTGDNAQCMMCGTKVPGY